MGGEPLCEPNLLLTYMVINEVRSRFPDIEIYIWSGYYYDELIQRGDPKTKQILEMANILVDGPYIESKRDLTLPLRGSSNQSIINLQEKKNG